MGIWPQKGRLDPGADADMVIFDPSCSWTVTSGNQHTNATYSLFEGTELLGRVSMVISRGELVVEGDEYLGIEGRGQFLSTRAGHWQG